MAQMQAKNTQQKKNVVWNTKRVDAWMRDYADGTTHKDSPWLDGVIGVRNPSIVFEYTPQEIQEMAKCANDIIYFANKYCYCMQGSRGYQPITLRDYQEEMLRAYEDNRFNVTLSCRQIGKCFFNGKLELQKDENNFHKYIEELYYDRKSGFLSRLKNVLLKVYRKL